MPLVVDQLQLWTIGFKWAGLDPNRLWLRIPEPVKDNFSTLLEAILNMHLDCMSLNMDKYHGEDRDEAMMHIRYWTEDIYAAINGRRYNRNLLKFALIDRGAFKDWCERCTIPLPEFWFPTGWTDYRWPEEDYAPIPDRPVAALLEENSVVTPSQEALDLSPSVTADAPQSRTKELRSDQLAKIVCKQIAKVIWKDEPYKTIADMSKDDRVLKFGGGQYYSEEVVRRWVKEVAPVDVSAKRGRPKKQNPTEDE